ncbi:MAG: hypothetical protein ABIJ12_07000 [bacterium]
MSSNKPLQRLPEVARVSDHPIPSGSRASKIGCCPNCISNEIESTPGSCRVIGCVTDRHTGTASAVYERNLLLKLGEMKNHAGHSFPHVKNPFLDFGETIPYLGRTFPHLGETFPHIENSFPHLGETFPHIENSIPKLGEPFPHVENPFPNVCRISNRIVWEKGHVKSLTSKT